MMKRSAILTRDDATRRVMKAIALTNDHEPLPLKLQDGSRPVVVALPGEYISEIVNRVVSIGGQANVAVAFTNHFKTVVLSKSANTSLQIMEINQDLSMGMFLIKLANNPGRTVRLKFRDVDTNVPEVTMDMAYA